MDIPSVLHNLPLTSVIAIIAGAIVLLVPRVLNYAIAVYLLTVGTLGLLQFFNGYHIRPQPLISLIAGILVLIRPAILSYTVGIYLILIGLLDSGIVRF